ncbi:MAG: hypothetical protein CME06_08245 [Gemmatimonadetes bacterium]|nr:hypothetical protein [Gemmatimonadota bacterium]
MALIDFGLLSIATVLGFGHVAGAPGGAHIGVALAAAVFTLITHCAVFTYLIGTGIGIGEAVDGHRLPEELKRRAARFKARAFPFALFSMLLVILTAALGARVDIGTGGPMPHLASALIALAFNLWTYPIEIRVAAENAELMAEINVLAEQMLERESLSRSA